MKRALAEILRCPLTGSALRLEAFESNGDRVESGVLTGLGGDYPIVAGIPVFLRGQHEALEYLRQSKPALAVASAAVGNRFVTVLDTLLKSHPLTNRLRRFTKPWDQRRRKFWLEAAAERLAPHSGRAVTAKDLYAFGFLECGTPSPEPYYYNFCRFAMPGYFVALAHLEAIGARKGFVLDHCCGSGHLSWAMRRLCAPAEVVACDMAYLSLYIARQAIEPEAEYVCAEIAHLPFRDGVFDVVFNSDAFNNVSAKLTAFEEMARTAGPDAQLVLVWLRNSAHPHLYGKPVSTEAYRLIAGALPHRFYSDAWVLRRFLGKPDRPPPAEDEVAGEALYSMWIGKVEGEPGPEPETFGQSPIPFDRLAVNPIYKANASGDGFERNYPSSFYGQEDAHMKFYYPERFSLTKEQQQALRENRVDGLQQLLRTGALVGWPERFA